MQVQVAYYRCTREATCLCAVAVQSGDSVFVADQCSRSSRAALCRDNPYFCTRGPQEVRMYFHDEVTPGTRIFRRKRGTFFEVGT